MFSWLKRRLHKEHRKLAWQNFEAAHDPEMKTLSGLYGDWDAYESYDAARNLSVVFIEELASGKPMSTELIDAALKLNRGLRTLYDQHGRAGRGSFDAVYKPLGGWSMYFDRSENELYLIEQQRKIDESIEEYERTGKMPF